MPGSPGDPELTKRTQAKSGLTFSRLRYAAPPAASLFRRRRLRLLEYLVIQVRHDEPGRLFFLLQNRLNARLGQSRQLATLFWWARPGLQLGHVNDAAGALGGAEAATLAVGNVHVIFVALSPDDPFGEAEHALVTLIAHAAAKAALGLSQGGTVLAVVGKPGVDFGES